MATYTSLQISNGVPQTQPHAGVVAFQRGRVNVTTNLAQNDILEFVKLPKGAIVCGMRLFGAAISTGVDIQVGNSASQTAYADLSGFDFTGSNEWLLTLVQDGDAVATTQEETVTLLANSLPGVPGTGNVYLDVYYTMEITTST